MAIDLTGGMDATSDHFLGAPPDDPQFRESASVWISDDRGVIGLPRVGIEAVASSWDRRGFQVNVGLPDGRAVIVREAGEGRSPPMACAADSRPVGSSSTTPSRSRR